MGRRDGGWVMVFSKIWWMLAVRMLYLWCLRNIFDHMILGRMGKSSILSKDRPTQKLRCQWTPWLISPKCLVWWVRSSWSLIIAISDIRVQGVFCQVSHHFLVHQSNHLQKHRTKFWGVTEERRGEDVQWQRNGEEAQHKRMLLYSLKLR